MSKNNIIGLLIAVVVLGGGYLLIHNSQSTVPPTTNQTNISTSPSTTNPTPTPAPTPAPTAAAPTVDTNSNTTTSSSTAIVTGTVNPNGASTSYWFEYGETTALGIQTVSQAVGSGFSAISTPGYITGLKANTLYYFRLSAKNRFATVNGAMYTFQTNTNPPPQGLAPTVSTSGATSVSRTTANINGQVNPRGSQTDYWFEYGTDTNLGSVIAAQFVGSGSSSLAVSGSLSGLAPLTRYYFRLNAQNQYGTVNGSIGSFVTSGPANPGIPTVTTESATNVTSAKATLNAHINPDGADTTYWFEYSQNSLLSSLIGSGTPEQTIPAGTSNVKVQADITNLQANTTYFYHIVAKNIYGTVYGGILSFRTRS